MAGPAAHWRPHRALVLLLVPLLLAAPPWGSPGPGPGTPAGRPAPDPSPAPRPRVVLHIGPHKTASTHIQSRLCTLNASQPLPFRLLLPPRPFNCEKGAAAFAFALLNDSGRAAAWGGPGELLPYLKEQVEGLRPGETAILSSEALDKLPPSGVSLLASLLSPADTTVLLFHRRWALQALSWCAYATGRPLLSCAPETLGWCLANNGDRSGMGPVALLRRWARVFGPENVVLVSLEGAVRARTDPLDALAAAALPAFAIPPPSTERTNVNTVDPLEWFLAGELTAYLRRTAGEANATALMCHRNKGIKGCRAGEAAKALRGLPVRCGVLAERAAEEERALLGYLASEEGSKIRLQLFDRDRTGNVWFEVDAAAGKDCALDWDAIRAAGREAEADGALRGAAERARERCPEPAGVGAK